MKLSILIPAIPERDRHAVLKWNLDPSLEVEILSLCDNMQRSVGAKRQALLDISRGEYIAFCDDDDRLTRDYLGAILEAIESGPDLITFKTDCTHFGKHTIVDSSLDYEDEQLNEGGVTLRRPVHVHVWRRSLAICSEFPDKSLDEGEEWAQKLYPLVKKEIHIDEVLYIYRCGPWSATQ